MLSHRSSIKFKICSSGNYKIIIGRKNNNLINNVSFSTTTINFRGNKNSKFTPYVPFPEKGEIPEVPGTEDYISLYESANNAKDGVLGRIQNLIGRHVRSGRTERRMDETKKATILEKILNATPSLKRWSDELLEEILLEFERSKEVRRSSTEMGVQILKFRSAVRKFVENVWNDKIDRCRRESLKQTYIDGGVSLFKVFSFNIIFEVLTIGYRIFKSSNSQKNILFSFLLHHIWV